MCASPKAAVRTCLKELAGEAKGIPVTTAWTHDLIASDHPPVLRTPRNHRRALREFHRSERGNAAGAREPSQHSSGQLQLAGVCAVCLQDSGGRGCTLSLRLDSRACAAGYACLHCVLRVFLVEMNKKLDDAGPIAGRHSDWLAWCKQRVARYSVLDWQAVFRKSESILTTSLTRCSRIWLRTTWLFARQRDGVHRAVSDGAS